MPISFPAEDLTLKYISQSYQDLVQIYAPGIGDPNEYFLDGLGNVLLVVPSSSVDQVIITSDVTSSMSVLTASFSNISALSYVSNVAILADTALIAVNSDFSISSSWASSSLSSSNFHNGGTTIDENGFTTTNTNTNFPNGTSIDTDGNVIVNGKITAASLDVEGTTTLDAGIITTDGAGNLTVNGNINANTVYITGASTLDNGQIVTDGSGSLNATSFTGSLLGTASWAQNIVGGSGTTLFTSSTYQITSSVSNTASYALNSATASSGGSYLIEIIGGGNPIGTGSYYFGSDASNAGQQPFNSGSIYILKAGTIASVAYYQRTTLVGAAGTVVSCSIVTGSLDTPGIALVSLPCDHVLMTSSVVSGLNTHVAVGQQIAMKVIVPGSTVSRWLAHILVNY